MSTVLSSAPVLSDLKAYLILHDASHVLVGSGGRSGKWKRVRGGLHLPGGTAEKYPPGLETRVVLVTAVRELEEETGIVLGGDVCEGLASIVQTTACPTYVYFVVQKLKAGAVAKLVSGFSRPKVTDPCDEPFAAIHALPLADCWKDGGFSDSHRTEWFGHGLHLVSSSGYFK